MVVVVVSQAAVAAASPARINRIQVQLEINPNEAVVVLLLTGYTSS